MEAGLPSPEAGQERFELGWWQREEYVRSKRKRRNERPDLIVERRKGSSRGADLHWPDQLGLVGKCCGNVKVMCVCSFLAKASDRRRRQLSVLGERSE